MNRTAILAAGLALLACSPQSTIFGSGPVGDGGGEGGVQTVGPGPVGGAESVSVTVASGGDLTSTATIGGGGVGGVGGEGGRAPECYVPSDCLGIDGECSWRLCVGGLCGTAYAAAGTLLAAQTAGDCYVTTCDGAGATTSIYTPTDKPSVVGQSECVAGSHCTPGGPVIEHEPEGTWCSETCVCPEHNGGTCGASGVWCTQGLCQAGTCVDAIPVTCVVGVNEYTRCDLTAGTHSIGWGNGNPDCEPGECHCSLLASDVGYCAPGTTCYVYGADGAWLGPQLGTGTCL